MKRGRVASFRSPAGAGARESAPPIYFWRMRFAVIDGDGGRGALSYGVSFAKRAIATARHGLRTCSRSAFSPLRRGRSRPLATALNLHMKRGRVASFRSPAGAGARESRAADLFLANAFCCDRRRRRPRRSELRGQLRQAGDRNSTTWPSDVLALRFFAPATGPIATARDRIEFAYERGRVASFRSPAGAGARESAPPIYFWRMRFAVIDGDGGRGALSYGVSFAKRAIATARHGLRTCSRSAFSPLRRGRSRPLATALNLHMKRGRVASFRSPAGAGARESAPPIYFWRMRFAVIDGDGGRGALSYGVSFAKRAIATARHGLRTCSRSAFSPLRRGRSRPLATALNLHMKRGRVASFRSPAGAQLQDRSRPLMQIDN